MSPSFYQIRECENVTCQLRYPLTEGHPFGERCPLCLGATRVALQRELNPAEPPPPAPFRGRGAQVEALLDNVRSAWNVGAIFRTADAFGVRRLHLCGITPTPENASVAKTALGADKTVAWTASRNALTTARALKAEGAQLWGLEQDERAVSTTDAFGQSDKRMMADSTTDGETDKRMGTDVGPIILIVGNGITGVDPALLDLCNKIVYIPMRGEKRSLNVEVAFGVCVSQLVG